MQFEVLSFSKIHETSLMMLPNQDAKQTSNYSQ